MSSPTTPLATYQRPPFSHVWRPWSQLVDEAFIRRSICGLLNKVTRRTIDNIAAGFAGLVARIERSGDPAVIETCARIVVQRCVADPSRVDFVATMVQRAVDEAEGEDLRWRSVDPYHLGNPAASFHSALKTAVLSHSQLAASSGHSEEAFALSAFLGELLVLGALCCEDVEDVVKGLFMETTRNSEVHCLALCRILRRVVTSTEASQIIDGLLLVDAIEGVLEEDTISLKIRYMMMDIHDQCLYPRPRDVFSSELHRSEVYGFHDDLDEDDAIVSPVVLAEAQVALLDRCLKEAKACLDSQDLLKAETFCKSLPIRRRYRFLHALIHVTLATGDGRNAHMVATFLTLPSSRILLGSDVDLAKAFEPDIALLEDTVLDVPFAYRLMAIMLSAAGFSQHELEDLASRIIIRENAARDHLLDEVAAFSVGGLDETLHLPTVIEETSEDETPSSEYAYAY
ncbi:hypothetical protein BV20DRAFT_1038864 [Pilatotrama ljubarskyi]|nr:hypothetical protein BV20DRAFT_1038864 [Pilatotrama ljubarskyi]